MRRSRDVPSLTIELLESRQLFSATPSLGLAGGAELLSSASNGNVKLPYSYYVAGNAGDIPANLTPQSSGLALMGGGLDVDEVFKWMGAKANGGDFLVIRATGTNAYDKYIDQLVPSLDSAATLIIPDRTAAMNADVARIIESAEAIFIAGGDQGNYVNFWNDTPVEAAIYQAILHHVPIGGTSAGLAVLGDVDFSSVAGTITSTEALANPLDSRIVMGLEANFLTPEAPELLSNPPTILEYLDNVITDSHFMQRDRMGRLLTFMADMDAMNLVPGLPRGIGVNEQTALLIEPDGLARVVGNAYGSRKLTPTEQQRSVYFFEGSSSNPLLLSNVPLEYSAHVVRASYDPVASYGDSFDLDSLFRSNSWSLPGLVSYDVVASGGMLTSFDFGDMVYGDINAKRKARVV